MRENENSKLAACEQNFFSLLFENSIADALYYHNQLIYADFHKSKCVLVPRPE